MYESYRFGATARVGTTPPPIWLVQAKDTPKAVRDAFNKLDKLNAESSQKAAALKAAQEALKTHDADVAVGKADAADRPALVATEHAAKSDVDKAGKAALQAAQACEDAMSAEREGLRRVAAQRAVEAHEKAVEALAELNTALQVREYAWQRAGKPDPLKHWSVLTTQGLPMRINLAHKDLAKKTEFFPVAVLQEIAEGGKGEYLTHAQLAENIAAQNKQAAEGLVIRNQKERNL